MFAAAFSYQPMLAVNPLDGLFRAGQIKIALEPQRPPGGDISYNGIGHKLFSFPLGVLRQFILKESLACVHFI
jgi:hypothetical protein